MAARAATMCCAVRTSSESALAEGDVAYGFDFVPLHMGFTASTSETAFVSNFASVGTLDDTPYLCIQAALEWRKKLSWNGHKGEKAIMDYTRDLARKGGQTVSSILATEIFDNEEGTLTDCSLVNVCLPLSVRELTGDDLAKSEHISQWIMKTMILEYHTAVVVIFYGGFWWVRLSAQVYLTLRDFERAGRLLKEACERVNRGEWNTAKSS